MTVLPLSAVLSRNRLKTGRVLTDVEVVKERGIVLPTFLSREERS